MEQLTRGFRTFVNASSLFLDDHKNHPLVEVSKVTLSVLALRADIERTSQTPSAGANFAKRHPFAAWLSSFLTAYAGSILASLLMAESPVKPFCNPDKLIYVTLAWFIVFYSPDFVRGILLSLPINAGLTICAEMYRCGNIQSGVKYAMKSSLAREVKLKPVLMILIGCVKGCGGSLARGIIRLVRSGTLKQSRKSSTDLVDNEFQTPTFFTKASLLVAAAFTGYWLRSFPPQYDYAMVHVAVNFFLISTRLHMAMAPDPKLVDPFATVEYLICSLFFGKETAETPAAAASAASATAEGDTEGETAGETLDETGEHGEIRRRR